MGSMRVVVLGFNVYVSTAGLQLQRTVNNAQFTKNPLISYGYFPINYSLKNLMLDRNFWQAFIIII